MDNTVKSAFGTGFFAITLLVKSLPESIDFYGSKLGLDLVFSDDNSALYQAGSTFINLLIDSEGPELVGPAKPGSPSQGVSAVYTIKHPDVDAVAAQLEAAGVALLSGPIDRPWGVRTLSFQDPSGHTFEVANHN
jgi:catechol 2,3-dioxygenase-like lactoylglutathione lyase family enzyme